MDLSRHHALMLYSRQCVNLDATAAHQEHLTAAQAMKVARRELQAADRDRDGILNRDETFKYFYGTLCIKFLSRKVVKSRSEVRDLWLWQIGNYASH